MRRATLLVLAVLLVPLASAAVETLVFVGAGPHTRGACSGPGALTLVIEKTARFDGDGHLELTSECGATVLDLPCFRATHNWACGGDVPGGYASLYIDAPLEVYEFYRDGAVSEQAWGVGHLAPAIRP